MRIKNFITDTYVASLEEGRKVQRIEPLVAYQS